MTSAARMTPIRANIVGSVLRRGQDQGFSQGLVLGFRKLGYVIAGILDVTSWRPRGNGIGSWNDRFQPRSATKLDGAFRPPAATLQSLLATPCCLALIWGESKYTVWRPPAFAASCHRARRSADRNADPKTRCKLRNARTQELATKAIEKIIDPGAPPEEQVQRRRRLTRGPLEFREARVDQPKAKGK
jgi:hypothetical protein